MAKPNLFEHLNFLNLILLEVIALEKKCFSLLWNIKLVWKYEGSFQVLGIISVLYVLLRWACILVNWICVDSFKDAYIKDAYIYIGAIRLVKIYI